MDRETVNLDARAEILFFLARRLGAWLLSVAVAYLLASIIATQSVVGALTRMGLDVPLGERLAMTGKDIIGMGGMFLPMVAFALLIAFMTAALLCRWLARWRLPLYLLAGAVAVACIHLGLHLAFGINPVAVARSTGGLLLQALAGAAGGFTYLSLTQRRAAG
jgi:hypothetical protein